MKVPLAPLPAAVTVKVTLTPGRTFELASFTVACKAAKVLLTTTLCVAPLVAEMVEGAVPVPLNETLKELGLPESLIVSVPVRVPVAVGLKMTLTVQLPPAVTVPEHELVPSR